MHLMLIVNGEKFISSETDEVSLRESEEDFYKNMTSMNKFQMTCQDGNSVCIAYKALENAIFVFDYSDNEPVINKTRPN